MSGNPRAARRRVLPSGRWNPLRLEALEDRTLLSAAVLLPDGLHEVEPNDTPATANVLGPDTLIRGSAAGGDVDVFQVTLPQDGRLTARVHAGDFAARLSLLDADGRLLAQSDGQTPADPDAVLVQHLPAADYFLAVADRAGPGGTYTLTTTFADRPAGFQPFSPPADHGGAQAIVTADFNHDRRVDFAAANYFQNDVTVYRGLGDGAFSLVQACPVGGQPAGLAAADVNGDGRTDLVVADAGSDDVAVLLGNGDGTFRPAQFFAAGSAPTSVAVGDFNGDGRPDLAVADFGSADYSVLIDTAENPSDSHLLAVLLGNGDGTFGPPAAVPVGRNPRAVVAADFDGDGRLDLASADTGGNDFTLLHGRGDGTFAAVQMAGVGSHPVALAVGDLDGDGRPDLVCADANSNDVMVLRPVGGLLRSAGTFPVEDRPLGLTLGDFNGDGRPDVAAVNLFTRDVAVLLDSGAGTLVNGSTLLVGNVSVTLAAADFDGDGRTDLLTAGGNPPGFAAFSGLGDGRFQGAEGSLGPYPFGLATADFNGDGRPDLVTAEGSRSGVAVRLGQAGGGFRAGQQFTVGGHVLGPDGQVLGAGTAAVAVGDFNGDGRPDLAVADFNLGQVEIWLGIGDGTFRPGARYAVGTGPGSLVAADFNGDGILDLAVANSGERDLDDFFERGAAAGQPGTVSVLLGDRDGTFRAAGTITVGSTPKSLAVADFNGDGRPDLAVADFGDDAVLVLLSNGDGTFQAAGRVPVGAGPASLVAGDFNGDGRPDLAVANFGNFDVDGNPDALTANHGSNFVSVLLNAGGGTFRAADPVPVGDQPRFLLAADLDRDGRLDLATADVGDGAVDVLWGDGGGAFPRGARFPVGQAPIALVAADFNGDGRPDVVSANGDSGDLTVLLGRGAGGFVAAGASSNLLPSRPPLLADLTGDGIPDAFVLDQGGKVLFRQGRPEPWGGLGPPRVVNRDTGAVVRDLAVVKMPGWPLLATVGPGAPAITLYSFGPAGTVTPVGNLDLPEGNPVLLGALDLNGDGLSDLVAVTDGVDALFVFLQSAKGGFGPEPAYRLQPGVDPTALTLTDVDGDGRPDIVVANRSSSDVSVWLNAAANPFATALRFRADAGTYFASDRAGALVVHSPVETEAAVVGDFTGDGVPDLLAVNSANLTLLPGDGSGGFRNPSRAATFPTGAGAVAAVTGDFNGDGHPDLAVLNEDDADLWVYLGDGAGGFRHTATLSAGNAPTGLALRDATGDGRLDLLVGNAFGDVLTLAGNGDGTFQPYRRATREVTLAVADLNGDGRPDFVLADQGLDRVAVRYSTPQQTFAQDRGDGLLAPGAVQLADLNGDGIPDLLVANSGGNNVLVYLGTGGGQFGPAHAFFTGTNPVAIAVRDLNGDGVPDLVVANQGSNDVSVLFGQGGAAGWVLTPGPRLQTGAGPVAVAVQDFNRDGIPDLIVSNGQGQSLSALRGVGGGFFDDRNPIGIRLPADPGGLVQLPGDPGGIGVTLPGAGGVRVIPDVNTPDRQREFGTGGADPVAVVAADVNGDGILDFLVADNDGGKVSLLLGTPTDFVVAQSLAAAHPTDLALAGVADNAVAVFVAEEGQDSSVALLTFTLAGRAGTSGGAGSDIRPREATPGVAPLPGSPGQLVPVLLVGETVATGGPPETVDALAVVLNLLLGPIAAAATPRAGAAGSGNAQQAPPSLEAPLRAVVRAAEGVAAGWRMLVDTALAGLQPSLAVLRVAVPVFEADSAFPELVAGVARALVEAGISTSRLLRAELMARMRGEATPATNARPGRAGELSDRMGQEMTEPEEGGAVPIEEGPSGTADPALQMRKGIEPLLACALFASGLWWRPAAAQQCRRTASMRTPTSIGFRK
jgi:hypothetical protein